MKLSITTALGGAGFALATYLVTLIIALVVSGMVYVMCRMIRGNGKAAGPAPEKK